MKTAMTPEAFTAAVAAVGWKQSDFCRRAGLTPQTASRWANGVNPIPAWVPAYLGAMGEIQRLYVTYVLPLKPSASDVLTDDDDVTGE